MLFGHRKGISIGMITGIQASVDTKFVNGSGVGASSRSAHRAKSRRAYIPASTIPPQPANPFAGSLLFDINEPFNTNNNYLTASPGIILGSAAYTIECWFYNMDVWGTASPNFNALLGCVVNSYSRGLNLEFVNDRTILTDYNAIGTRLTYSFDSAISLNAWHHFALVRDSNKIESAFIDGKKAISSTGGTGQSGGQQTNSLNYSGGSDSIGRTYEGQWRGYITNFRAVAGTAIYDPTASSITIPTGPLTKVTGTQYLMLANNVTTDSADVQTIATKATNSVTQDSSKKPF